MAVSDTVRDLEDENKRLKGLIEVYQATPLRLRYVKLDRFAELRIPVKMNTDSGGM